MSAVAVTAEKAAVGVGWTNREVVGWVAAEGIAAACLQSRMRSRCKCQSWKAAELRARQASN